MVVTIESCKKDGKWNGFVVRIWDCPNYFGTLEEALDAIKAHYEKFR